MPADPVPHTPAPPEPDRAPHGDPAPAVLIFRRARFSIPPGGVLRDTIHACAIPPELVIAVRGGRIIEQDERVRPGDQIRLIATIVGG